MMLDVELIQTAGNVRIDENDVTDLAASIDRIGLLNPLVVRHVDDEWTLIAGHRRFAAIKQLGWTTVQVVENETVHTVADRLAAQYAENVIRKDLSPYEQALVALDLKAEGLNQGAVATELGLSKSQVSKMQKAASVVGALPNAADASALTQEALFALAETEIGEGEQSALIRENALRLISQGEARTVSSALGAAEREAKAAIAMEHIQPIYDELRERNIAFVGDDDTGNLYRYQKLFIHAFGTRVDTSSEFDADACIAHRDEPCHVVELQNDYWGPRLTEYCKSPKRHAAKGASVIKENDAEAKAETKQKQSEERKAVRQEKEQRVANVSAVLNSSWATKHVVDVMGATVRLPADAQRVTAKALGLDIKPSKHSTNYPDYGATIDAWIETLPEGKRPYAPVLLLAAYAYLEMPYMRNRYKELFRDDT